MVHRVTRNPLLKGMPGRGFRHTVKHHETGRRVSVKNPAGPQYREYPHLAHWTPAEFDALNAQLEKQNQGFDRKPVNGVDPRWQVPRKRTRFPGQYARCWYCGRHYVWGGNGMTDNLRCAVALGNGGAGTRSGSTVLWRPRDSSRQSRRSCTDSMGSTTSSANWSGRLGGKEVRIWPSAGKN